MTDFDLWIEFLANERLSIERVGIAWVSLCNLCLVLATGNKPKWEDHQARIETRRLIARTAINLKIDLAAIHFKGKSAMGAALLEVWREESERKFGSNSAAYSDKSVLTEA